MLGLNVGFGSVARRQSKQLCAKRVLCDPGTSLFMLGGSRQVKSASRSPPRSPSLPPLLPPPHLRSPFAHPRLTTTSPSPGEPLMARRSSPSRQIRLLDPASSLHPPRSRRRTCNHGHKRLQIQHGPGPALDPSSERTFLFLSFSLCLSFSPPLLAQLTAVKISVRSIYQPIDEARPTYI